MINARVVRTAKMNVLLIFHLTMIVNNVMIMVVRNARSVGYVSSAKQNVKRNNIAILVKRSPK